MSKRVGFFSFKIGTLVAILLLIIVMLILMLKTGVDHTVINSKEQLRTRLEEEYGEYASKLVDDIQVLRPWYSMASEGWIYTVALSEDRGQLIYIFQDGDFILREKSVDESKFESLYDDTLDNDPLSKGGYFVNISAGEEATIRRLYEEYNKRRDGFHSTYFPDNLPADGLNKYDAVLERISLNCKMDCGRAIGAAYDVIYRQYQDAGMILGLGETHFAWRKPFRGIAIFECDKEGNVIRLLDPGYFGMSGANIEDELMRVINGLDHIELSVTFGESKVLFGLGSSPNFDDIIKYTGKTESKGFHPAYGWDAVFHDYTADGILAHCLYIKESGEERIYHLTITDPTAKTYRGIGIGSTMEEFLTAYPESEDGGLPESPDFDECRNFLGSAYWANGIAYFKDGKVAKIFFYGSAS